MEALNLYNAAYTCTLQCMGCIPQQSLHNGQNNLLVCWNCSMNKCCHYLCTHKSVTSLDISIGSQDTDFDHRNTCTGCPVLGRFHCSSIPVHWHMICHSVGIGLLDTGRRNHCNTPVCHTRWLHSCRWCHEVWICKTDSRLQNHTEHLTLTGRRWHCSKGLCTPI